VEAEGDGRPLLALSRPILVLLQGDWELAQKRLAETLEHPDPWVRAAAVLMRAHVAENTGDQVHMRADLERAAEGFRALGDTWGLGMTLASQASSLMLADDLDGAETLLEEASELLDVLNGSNREMMLWPRLADLRLRRGELTEARALVERAVESADQRREESVFFRAMLARLAWLAGDFDELRELVADAARRIERLGSQRPNQGHGLAMVTALQAVVAMEDGDLDAAAARAAEAVDAAIATTDMPIVAMAGIVVCELELRRGRAEDAAERLGAAAVLRGADDFSNLEVARLIAALRERLGDAAFDAAYARGRGLEKEAALSRMPPVGA
jgi:ATP/maltotriose-dependent transcriptional regulator MalT